MRVIGVIPARYGSMRFPGKPLHLIAGKAFGLHRLDVIDYFPGMSSVEEIEAAIPRLSRAEVEALRAWIDDFLEDQLEISDDVKQKLDESRAEIAEGNYTTRQPE